MATPEYNPDHDFARIRDLLHERRAELTMIQKGVEPTYADVVAWLLRLHQITVYEADADLAAEMQHRRALQLMGWEPAKQSLDEWLQENAGRL